MSIQSLSEHLQWWTSHYLMKQPISYLNGWQYCPAFFLPSGNSTNFLGELLLHSMWTRRSMLLPGLFALTSISCLSPAPLCIAGKRELTPLPRPIVPGSHVSWVLVGLTNGRYWQENRGWGKGKTVLRLHFFHGLVPAPPGQIHHGFNLHWNTFSLYPSNLARAVASLLVTSELLHCSQGDFWTSFVTCV